MSSINTLPDGRLCAFVKGAPRELLEISNKIALGNDVRDLTAEKKAQVNTQIDNLPARACAFSGSRIEP